MQKVVHVNGYNLRELSTRLVVNRQGAVMEPVFSDWEEVCWGKGAQLGRIPMALWLARTIDASHLIWSTGCSRMASGAWEAEVLYLTARERFEQLHAQFPHRFTKSTWRTRDAYCAWLERISRFDTTSADTLGSMNVAYKLLLDIRGRVMFYTVSSANHVPRVGRDAANVFGIGTGDAPAMQRIALCTVFAETNYGGKTVRDTIVKDLGN